MDKQDLGGDDSGRVWPKKRAAVGTDRDRPLEEVRTIVSGGTQRLVNIAVPPCLIGLNKGIEVEHLVIAQNVKEGVDLPLYKRIRA